MYRIPNRFMAYAAILFVLFIANAAFAEKIYGPGVTDTEIKLGQTMPYSGPVAGYSTVGRAMAAYFTKVNAEGGVNGRKLKLISLDDAFTPPKTVEQTRRLVEQDEVLAIFGTLGTPTNSAIAKYLNSKNVPQLLILTGNPKLGDTRTFRGPCRCTTASIKKARSTHAIC